MNTASTSTPPTLRTTLTRGQLDAMRLNDFIAALGPLTEEQYTAIVVAYIATWKDGAT